MSISFLRFEKFFLFFFFLKFFSFFFFLKISFLFLSLLLLQLPYVFLGLLDGTPLVPLAFFTLFIIFSFSSFDSIISNDLSLNLRLFLLLDQVLS